MKKLIVFCLALSFIIVLPAKDPNQSSPGVYNGKDLTYELSLDGNISPVAMSQDGEVNSCYSKFGMEAMKYVEQHFSG